MPSMRIDSRVFGASVRSKPAFGKTIIGYLKQSDKVEITGDQQGDRWMPCKARLKGVLKNGFISKHVLRESESTHKENLMAICVAEWFRFDRGEGQEHIKPYSDYVGEYWSSIGLNLNGTDRDTPWSAAYISYCIRKAGGYSGFKYSAAHSKYVHQAIDNKLSNKNSAFWGYKISEHKPVLGDIVCRSRNGSKLSYNFAAKNSAFKSHCDIVVRITDSHVVTLGGNVGHAVSKTNYPLNSRGNISSSSNVYAVLKNNR